MEHSDIEKMAKAKAYDNFVKALENDFENVDRFIGFISVDEKERRMLEKSLKMLRKKIKTMKNVTSLKEAKQHVKMKAIYYKKEGM